MKALKLGVALILVTSLNAACDNDGMPAGNTNQTAGKNAPAATAGDAGAGEHAAASDLYRRIGCAACHGADGKGNATLKNIPNFADAAWQQQTDDAAMVNVIKNGKPPMPPYKSRLTDEQVKALVAYVRSFAK